MLTRFVVRNSPAMLARQQYAPTGKRLEASPECISLVFDEKTGMCTKMTGGFTLDRGAGNTRPAAGIWGVLKVRQ